jgi:hypothetical protein
LPEPPHLPDFFLAGAPKAGTTSLYRYLDSHPGIYMSPIKAPCFFASEVRVQNFAPALQKQMAADAENLKGYLAGPMREKRSGGIVVNEDDYHRLFAASEEGAVLGEASDCYLWSPSAPGRIAASIPNAKIVLILRSPPDRAFSQYLDLLGMGQVSWSFCEHIRRNLNYTSGKFCDHYPFLEYGLYGSQLQRYFALFGSNVRTIFYEDFRDRPLEAYRSICGFLGVRNDFTPDMGRRYRESQVPRMQSIGWLRRIGLWRSAAAVMPSALRPFFRSLLIRKPGVAQIDPADRAFLVDHYREDVRTLSGLLGLDLDAWLEHGYAPRYERPAIT